MNHILEKLSRDGWTVTIRPRQADGFHVSAEKSGQIVTVHDEYSPANAVKMLDEQIYGN